MDTTPKYIKMCDCPEIQRQLPRQEDEIGRKYVDGINYTLKYSIKSRTIVWLPRQDQLQERIKYDSLWIMLADFKRFAQPMDNHGIKSMEQLWLAFIMKEKFNKIWDDKEEIWT